MADTPLSLLAQQAVVGTAALALATAAGRVRLPVQASAGVHWPLMALTACVWLPLIAASSSSPTRWVGVFGFRVYVASVAVPTLLWLFLRSVSARASLPAAALLAASLTALALILQPDAPQLLAVTVGSSSVLLISRLAFGIKALVLGLLVSATAAAWATRVSLEPVPYVEGVFALARSHSYLLWFVAVVLAALPCMSLARTAWNERNPAALGLCLYFTTLYLQAPLQATPVPLLGFGAGPILGYFLVATCLHRTRTTAA